jgi:hypothetical protein
MSISEHDPDGYSNVYDEDRLVLERGLTAAQARAAMASSCRTGHGGVPVLTADEVERVLATLESLGRLGDWVEDQG